jgi:hypothetical protein
MKMQGYTGGKQTYDLEFSFVCLKFPDGQQVNVSSGRCTATVSAVPYLPAVVKYVPTTTSVLEVMSLQKRAAQ